MNVHDSDKRVHGEVMTRSLRIQIRGQILPERSFLAAAEIGTRYAEQYFRRRLQGQVCEKWNA